MRRYTETEAEAWLIATGLDGVIWQYPACR